MRALFGRLDEPVLAVAGRAFQIAEFVRTHRFCGSCGAQMAPVPGERAMRCACGHSAYPRISPAMMVLVKRGRSILLARNVAVPAGGRMSALAGFLEPGESIEDAIHREVREEVGLEVRDPRYFASQSWPYPHSLMIAFTAEYAGGELRLDPAEIAEARWFGPGDALPELSPRQSISRALIDANLP
jgi:NAD+ diphosphatase